MSFSAERYLRFRASAGKLYLYLNYVTQFNTEVVYVLHEKIASDLVWVGANDRRLAMFEGVYSVPAGVSYNSYLLTDEKTVLFDTVDKAVSRTFFENLEHELGGRPLDYVIVHHMEPDHSATLSELLLRHPETTVVCNDKTAVMIAQFSARTP